VICPPQVFSVVAWLNLCYISDSVAGQWNGCVRSILRILQLPTEIRLPKLGKTMQQAIIVGCSVQPGDQVQKGDNLFEIETDKAAMEIESPATGCVKHIFAEIGQTLRVGQPVMLLTAPAEIIPPGLVESLKEQSQPVAAEQSSMTPPGGTPETVVKPGDIKFGKTIALTRKQIITAQKMLDSKRHIPCFYLTATADMTDVAALRRQLNNSAGVKVSYNDFIIRAVATALGKFPTMTGQLVGDTIVLADSIHIALAIDLPDGVVAPVIKNAAKKSVTEIAGVSSVLIEKARSNKLAPNDLDGACITISNLGAFGADRFIPIVVPGQCSILGIGTIGDSVLPDETGHQGHEEAKIVVRKLMTMTLSVDHRIANGSYAARFLDFARKQLEDPSNFA